MAHVHGNVQTVLDSCINNVYVHNVHRFVDIQYLQCVMTSVYSECVCHTIYMSVITQDGQSALMMAARCGKTDVAVELVKAGANVDMQDNVCLYL